MTISNPTDRSPRRGRDVRRPLGGLVAGAAIGVMLALATVAAAQTPNLGAPDVPPPSAVPAAPSTPEPAAPAAPSPAPSSPAPSSPAPSSPSSEPAEPSPSQAAAAAARRRAQQRRAAQARERRRAEAVRRARLEAAERRQTLRATAVVAARVATDALVLTRTSRAAVADAPDESGTDTTDEDGRGQMVLLALLVASVLGIGLALLSRVVGRPSSLDRFRLELVGVSVACMLIVALVAAGIV